MEITQTSLSSDRLVAKVYVHTYRLGSDRLLVMIKSISSTPTLTRIVGAVQELMEVAMHAIKRVCMD